MKQVGNPLTGGYKEYYIRDAQGNVMATYRYTNNGAASLKLTDRPIYGSSRVGSHTQEMELYATPDIFTYPYTQPMPVVKKRYELTDHLGNVNTVVSGKLLPMPGGGYQAEVVSAQGYEPFGALLPGRSWSSDGYRWGFNGMEKVNEVYGSTGNSYDFGARLYDPRVGRWLSLDPLAKKYPELSPYNFTANNPVQFVDRDGRVIVDPSTNEPVVKVSGQWKTVKGTNSDGTPIYGQVSDRFVAVSQPILDRLTSHDVGNVIYEQLQSISTLVVFDPTNEDNLAASQARGGSNSEWHPEPDRKTNEDGLYIKVIISPLVDAIDERARQGGIDPDEKFLQTMSVEAGHIGTKAQVGKELSYKLKFNTPEKFADVYNSLLNEAIRVGKAYRAEVGKEVDASSNIPITTPQATPLGSKLQLEE